MSIYMKLVRDRIPEIIEASGRKPVFRNLDEEGYRRELRTKLQEEVQEYLEAENVEELADVMEVLFALAKVHGADEQLLMQVRAQKQVERGGFDGRLFLEKVEG